MARETKSKETTKEVIKKYECICCSTEEKSVCVIPVEGTDGFLHCPYCNSVVVDSSNNAIVAGFVADPNLITGDIEDYDVIVTKYGGILGSKLDENIITTYAIPNKIDIDNQNKFVIAGLTEQEGSPQYFYTLKLDSNLNKIWENYDNTEGYLTDLAIMSNDDIAVSGRNWEAGYGLKYYGGICDKNNGNIVLDMSLGFCITDPWDPYWGIDRINGVTVDNVGDLYFVGAATVAKTMKVQITQI